MVPVLVVVRFVHKEMPALVLNGWIDARGARRERQPRTHKRVFDMSLLAWGFALGACEG